MATGAGRAPDGLRHAACAGGDRGLLHRHPARPPADGGAAGRPDSPLRGDRRNRRRWRPAPRPSATACRPRSTTRAPGRFVVRLGLKHADPKVEAGVAGAGARGRRAHRRPRAGAPLLDAVGRRVPRAGRRGGRRGRAPVRRHRELGHRARLRRVPGRGRSAAASPPCRPTPRSCSPPTRCPHGSSPPATRTRTSSGRPRRPWPPSPGSTRGRHVVDRLAVGRPDAGAVDRPRHPDRRSTSWRRRRTPTGCWSARAASWPTTSRCCTTSTSRPASGREAQGLAFDRTASMNDDPTVLAALADADRRARSSERACAARPGGSDRSSRRCTSDERSDASSSSEAGSRGLTTALYLAGQTDRTTSRSSSGRPTTGWAASCAPLAFAGLPAVDEGADAFLARVPAATQLAADVGLGDELTSPDARARPPSGSTACTRSPRAWRSACPTGLRRPGSGAVCSRSRGKLRAALEPLLPRARDHRRQHRPPDPQPVRRRGAGAAGRRADRQHLRRRHRPLQPRRRAPAGRAERRAAACCSGPARRAPPPRRPTARSSWRRAPGMAALVDAVAGPRRGAGVVIRDAADGHRARPRRRRRGGSTVSPPTTSCWRRRPPRRRRWCRTWRRRRRACWRRWSTPGSPW